MDVHAEEAHSENDTKIRLSLSFVIVLQFYVYLLASYLQWV